MRMYAVEKRDAASGERERNKDRDSAGGKRERERERVSERERESESLSRHVQGESLLGHVSRAKSLAEGRRLVLQGE